jgi:hypothetical protein
LWRAKEPPFSAGASREQARTNRYLHLAGALKQIPPVDGLKFNSHAKRIGVIDRASSWTSAPIRDELLRPPLDRAAENLSLEGSFQVVVPVASWFEVSALS